MFEYFRRRAGRVHLVGDVPQPVLVLAEWLGNAGNGVDGAGIAVPTFGPWSRSFVVPRACAR